MASYISLVDIRNEAADLVSGLHEFVFEEIVFFYFFFLSVF